MHCFPFKHQVKHMVAIFCCLLLAFLVATGIPEVAQSQHLSTRIFTEIDGLPSNAIFDIAQDNNGEMWFATRGGVARYDGHQWTSYGRGQGLLRDNFRRITTDETGTVWAVSITAPFAVSFFSQERWQDLPTPVIKKLGWDLSAFKAHIREDGTTVLAISSATSITLWDGDHWHFLESLGEFSGISALEWVGEDLWVATENGLRGIDIKKNTYLQSPVAGLPEGAVLGIALAPDGVGIDLLGSHWLGTVKNGQFKLLSSSLDIALNKKDSGVDLLRGPAGGWYFGDQENLYYYHRDLGQQNLSINNGMASNGASSLFQDKENNIWVASLRGLTKISGRYITSFNQAHGLLADEVTSVLQLRSGAMVLGHNTGLSFLGDPLQTIPFVERSGISSRVVDLTEGPDGKIWFAADRFGLGYIDQQKSIHWIPATLFPSQGTYAVLFDQQEQLWVGGSHGLFKRERDRFLPVPLPEMDPNLSPFVRRLTLDTDGSIFVATGMHGIYHLTEGSIHHWRITGKNGVPKGAFCVAPLKNGEYFIGTNTGLYRINGNHVEKTVAPYPVIDRPIYSITTDAKGRVWFGSDVGALCWDDNQLIQYDINDGLLGNETNRDALFMDDKGDMWIGTDQGLSIYRPQFDLKAPGKPLASLTSIEVDKELFPAAAPIEVASSFQEMVIRFRGITMLQENNIKFRTWLEPFQSNWQTSRKIPTREVRYTNLSPGTYTFHLQAIRGDGALSDIIHSQPITVLPPIWWTWWFISVALLITIGIIWSVFFYLSSRRYTSSLQKAIMVKTAELNASETAFKVESQRLSTTLQIISDGVITVSNSGIIESVNYAAQVVIERPIDEILGARLNSIFALADLDEDETEKSASFSAGLPSLFCFTTIEGTKKSLEVSISNIDEKDGHSGSQILAFREVTESNGRKDCP